MRNVVPPLRRLFKRKQLSSEGEMRVGKIASACMVVYITLIALYLSGQEGKGIFEMVLMFAAAVNFPLTLPTFLALIFRRAPRCSALISTGMGLIVPWILFPILKRADIAITFQLRVLIIGLSSVTGYFLSYAFAWTDPEDAKESIRDFYRTMHTPVDFEKEVGHSNDHLQMLILGKLSLLVAALMALLLLVPNALWQRACIAGVAASVGLIGGLLLWAGKRRQKTLNTESASCEP
jgi:hypothetical protein